MTPEDTPVSTESDALDPDRARHNPQEAVDALEEKVLGGPDHRLDSGYGDDTPPGEEQPEPESGPVFDVDLDPEEQGEVDESTTAPD